MNNIDLTKPTRQSPKGLVIIFLLTLRKFFKAFWPLLIIYVIRNEQFQENKDVILIASGVILLLLLTHAILYFLNFYFYVKDGEFILKKGYFQKQTLSIPLERIQNLNTKQNLVQQVLKVITLEIDTAGTGKKELKIHALNRAYTEALSNTLSVSTKNEVENDETAEIIKPKEQTILKLSFSELFKIGISRNHIRTALIILAFGSQIYQDIEDIFKAEAEKYSGAALDYISNSGWIIITTMVVLFLIISIFISVLNTILKYFDLKLTKSEKSLKMISGLLNRRNVLIPYNKVQELKWETSPLMRMFRIFKVTIGQATSTEVKTNQQVTIPGCNSEHVKLLQNDFFVDENVESNQRYNSDPYYFRRLWILRGWLIVLAFAPFFYNQTEYWIFAPAWLLITAMYSTATIKKRFFKLSANQIVISRGTLAQEWSQLENYKLQNIKYSQSFWQKRRGLATIKLHTASGNFSIPYIEQNLAIDLFNYLLYKIESTNKAWM